MYIVIYIITLVLSLRFLLIFLRKSLPLNSVNYSKSPPYSENAYGWNQMYFRHRELSKLNQSLTETHCKTCIAKKILV